MASTKLARSSRTPDRRNSPKKFSDLSFVHAVKDVPKNAWSPRISPAELKEAFGEHWSSHVGDIQYQAGSEIGYRAAAEFVDYLAIATSKDSEGCELLLILEAMLKPMIPELPHNWRRGEIDGFLFVLQEKFVEVLQAKRKKKVTRPSRAKAA